MDTILLFLSLSMAFAGVASGHEPTPPAGARTVDTAPPAEAAAAARSAQPDAPKVIVPADRPQWVESAPSTVDGVRRVAVSSEPYVQEAECRQALEARMQDAVDAYIDDYLEYPGAANSIHFGSPFVERELVAARPDNPYHEEILTSVGPMRQIHVLLEFDADFRKIVDRRWKEVVVASRLGHSAIIAGGLLLALATFYVYLRADTATRGYYTGRLQASAAVVILALVALGMYLAARQPWM
jgi:hypothetical protein